MANPEKKRTVETLREEIGGTENAILVDFKGLDVDAATELRRRIRERQARFTVVKNTLALRAFEDSSLEKLDDAFVGQTAIAYTDDDVVGLAKALNDFADEFEVPRFKAGLVDGEPISAEDFEALADLPSRDELVAKLLYLMLYPVTGLVTALSGVSRNLVMVLEQIRREKEGTEEAG